jgi:hypothetical protein
MAVAARSLISAFLAKRTGQDHLSVFMVKRPTRPTPVPGGYFINGSTDATGSASGVSGNMTGAGNTGYAGYFSNSGGGAVANFGVYARTNATGQAAALYATQSGASNLGYAVYALNSSATGWGVYSAGTSPNYFAGNVGIGTTAPLNLLTVTNTGGTAVANFANTGTGANSFYIYPFTDSNTYLQHDGNVVFSPVASTTPQLAITTSSSVGIGTTSPQQKLHVIGNAEVSGFFSLDTGNIYVGNTDMSLYGWNGGTAAMVIKAANRAATAMTIDASNNVGIGTTAPANTLDINGGSGAGIKLKATYGPHLTMESTSGSDRLGSIVFMGSGASDLWYVGSDLGASNTQNFSILDRIANKTRFYIDPSGNVGINNTGPGSSLDVKGTLRLSGSTSGYVGFTGAAAAGSTTYTLPTGDGTSGQALTTNGAGTWSWATLTGTAGNPAGTSGQVQFAGSSAFAASANFFWDNTNVRLGIGTNAPGSSLDISQRTDALSLPSGTTGQEPGSPVNGMVRYNSTSTRVEAYQNGAWNSFPAYSSATVATSQTTSSATYTDLTTTGPAVTVTTGTGAIVTVTGQLSNNTASK